jgi:hypothetical protein
MAKKEPRKPAAAAPAPGKTDAEDTLDLPTLFWALGILAFLILLQRLIWGG